jgi:preprotein translocase subunit SecG
MIRNLKFDLDVDTNALLCPNPDEFYSKAYLTEDIADNYRTLPGIKSATKLANVTFGNILAPSTCNFSAPTDNLDAVDIDVCALSAMAQICQFDLEQSFLALQMSQGSNGDFTVASFMSYYWTEMAARIGNDLELIRWQGDTTSENDTLALCDGYIKKLCADNAVNGLYTDAITSSNVLARMTAVLQASPAAVQAKRNDLRLFVSSDVFVNYQIAAASGNTLTYVTAPLAPTFLGIKIVLAEGMPTSTMVLALKTDLIYAFDAEGDAKALKAVNLSDSVAEPYIRTRANLKAGFHYTNPDQIVMYNVCFD